MRKHITGVVLVVGLGQKRDGAGKENGKVENDIGLGHLFHPVRRKRVDKTAKDGQRGHDSDGLTSGGKPVEVAANGDSSQEKLSRAIFRRGYTGDLPEQVDPAGDPGDRRYPFRGRQSGHTVVQPTTGRIRRDQFGDGACNAHATSTGDQPTPYYRGCTTCFERINERRRGRREQSRDAHSEGES
jgi:hypothetical protein